MEPYNIRCFDNIVGNQCVAVVCGECAFMRKGLTTFRMADLISWTNLKEAHGCRTPFISWLYNPVGKSLDDTTPSPMNPNIHEPSKERAIVEYIKFLEYFDEGILIEGLKDYMSNESDLSELYRIADKYKIPKEELDYWLEEARNDREV